MLFRRITKCSGYNKSLLESGSSKNFFWSDNSFFSPKKFTHQNPTPSPSKRWQMLVPAFMAHLCIGTPYGWSVVAQVLAQNHGFVVPSTVDWTLSQATFPLGMSFALFGVCAALAGKRQIH